MLRIEQLSKTYAGGVQALCAISLEVGCGIFGLLGPNGAGKSTLMRTLATLQRPDAGTVWLDGLDLLADVDAARQRIGYLPQDFGLYPNVSAEALLDQLALYKGLTQAAQRRQRVAECLEMVNLQAQRRQPLGGFSGGMRQRFGIAQALLAAPRLLIVDEPTAGLDPAERIRLQNLLSALAADRVVLLSTHIVEDVQALCSEVAVMRAGSLVARGTPEALVAGLQGRVWQRQVAGDQAPGSPATGIDAPGMLISARLLRGRQVQRVLAAQSPGADFERVQPDLDDVYFTALAA